MAIITPGTDGTLKSTTLEGQVHELLCLLQKAEANLQINPQEIDYITGTHNQTDFLFEASFTFPIELALNSQGQAIAYAGEYLTGLGFTPGTDGTFKSATTLGYLLEMITYGQMLEANPTTNPTNSNNLTATLNTDTKRFTGSVSLPVEMILLEDGGVSYRAKVYLT